MAIRIGEREFVTTRELIALTKDSKRKYTRTGLPEPDHILEDPKSPTKLYLREKYETPKRAKSPKVVKRQADAWLLAFEEVEKIGWDTVRYTKGHPLGKWMHRACTDYCYSPGKLTEIQIAKLETLPNFREKNENRALLSRKRLLQLPRFAKYRDETLK